mgnify:CR=1 FL=1
MSDKPPYGERSEDSFEALLRESARVTADYDADQDDLEAVDRGPEKESERDLRRFRVSIVLR